MKYFVTLALFTISPKDYIYNFTKGLHVVVRVKNQYHFSWSHSHILLQCQLQQYSGTDKIANQDRAAL